MPDASFIRVNTTKTRVFAGTVFEVSTFVSGLINAFAFSL